jgi:hypothetical protein
MAMSIPRMVTRFMAGDGSRDQGSGIRDQGSGIRDKG